MFHDHRLTRHAATRMQQRGMREDDLAILFACASQVANDAYLLTDKDAAREIEQRKSEIQTLERLRGTKVVVAGGVIVTCYHSRPADQKQTLRFGRSFQ